jgi:hypothetical protein
VCSDKYEERMEQQDRYREEDMGYEQEEMRTEEMSAMREGWMKEDKQEVV